MELNIFSRKNLADIPLPPPPKPIRGVSKKSKPKLSAMPKPIMPKVTPKPNPFAPLKQAFIEKSARIKEAAVKSERNILDKIRKTKASAKEIMMPRPPKPEIAHPKFNVVAPRLPREKLLIKEKISNGKKRILSKIKCKIESAKLEIGITLIMHKIQNKMSYFNKHESLLHPAENELLKIPDHKIDQICGELSREQEYIDELGDIGREVNRYALSAKKAGFDVEASSLMAIFKEYKYKIMSVRKIILKRLEFIKKRKAEERRKLSKENDAISKLRLQQDYNIRSEDDKLRKLSGHLHTNLAAQESAKAMEFESLKRLESLEQKNMFDSMRKFREGAGSISKIRKPKPVKPVIEKKDVEALKEISLAIEEAKAAKPVITDNLKYVTGRIDEARKALADFDIEAAKHIYLELMPIYKELKPTEKIKVYEDLKELYEERKIAENLITA